MHLLGVPFTSLVSDNGKFKLVIENRDEFLIGHLVLYQVLDDYKDENNVQLWHSDYASKGSKALITVKYKKTLDYDFALTLSHQRATASNKARIFQQNFHLQSMVSQNLSILSGA